VYEVAEVPEQAVGVVEVFAKAVQQVLVGLEGRPNGEGFAADLFGLFGTERWRGCWFRLWDMVW